MKHEVVNPSNPNVHSLKELNALDGTIESIIVDSGCCNDSSFTELSMKPYPCLKSLVIGHTCFAYVKELLLIGMHHLESVKIGTSCFLHKNGCFHVKDCHGLKELKIGRFSFSDYGVCEIENVNRLEVIAIGDLKEPSYCFFYASLELRCESYKMGVTNRHAKAEISSHWQLLFRGMPLRCAGESLLPRSLMNRFA